MVDLGGGGERAREGRTKGKKTLNHGMKNLQWFNRNVIE